MARDRRTPRQARPAVSRRGFLAAVAVTGAATTVPSPKATGATAAAPAHATVPRPSALPPTMHVAVAETATPKELPRIGGVAGSDFMVDVIKTLDIKYLPSNPASSFRALHESLINYGGNKMPEFLTCTHEESAVGMAHGYFKAAGKPLMTLCPRHRRPAARHHGDLQRLVRPRAGHRDRRQRSRRRPPAARRADLPFGAGHQRDRARLHQVGRHAGVAAALRAVVRARLQDRDDAALRAGCISLDAGLQQEPITENGEKLYIPNYVPTSPPQGDTGAVKEAARLLANAQNPVIVVDRAARTENGMRLLVQLAEASAGAGRRPGRPHELPEDPLSQPLRRRAVSNADVIIGLELSDFWGVGERLHRQRRARHRHQRDQDQARHQADQHQLGRAAHQVELPGLPALPVGRRVDAGRRRGDAARR